MIHSFTIRLRAVVAIIAMTLGLAVGAVGTARADTRVEDVGVAQPMEQTRSATQLSEAGASQPHSISTRPLHILKPMNWVGDWSAYFRCVAGIGVPVGIAIGIALTMPVWLIGYLARGSWSAERIAWSLGFGGIAKYAKAVGRSCMQFIHS